MHLNKQQRLQLKAQSHHLKVIVIIGNQGLTPMVLKEINNALDAHELVKVRINTETREEREEIVNQITEALTATMITSIGHVVTFYRQHEEK